MELLQQENDRLKIELGQRRRVVSRQPEDAAKISNRLVLLQHVPEDANEKLLKTYYMNINGLRCAVQHPASKKYHNYLSGISKKISTEYKRQHGDQPAILNANRSNIYLTSDFAAFADQVINEYCALHPFHAERFALDWSIP